MDSVNEMIFMHTLKITFLLYNDSPNDQILFHGRSEPLARALLLLSCQKEVPSSHRRIMVQIK